MRTIIYTDVFGKPMSWYDIIMSGTMAMPHAFYSPEHRDTYARALLRLNQHDPEAVSRALHIDKPVWAWPSWLYDLRMQVTKEMRQ